MADLPRAADQGVRRGWDTSRAYLDARWEIVCGRVFFGLGLGAAVHNGERELVEVDRTRWARTCCSTSPSSWD